MPIRTTHSDKAPAAIGPYSQAVIANGFLFTAGQVALDPASMQIVEGDVVAQTEQVLRNLDAVLASAGASWTDVVKTTVFLTDMRDFPRMNEVYARAMGDARPARSTVQVSGLPRGVLVEIDLIAALPTSS
ncbi:MAG: RidA family protein [Gemmatimonadaceae bacterium]